MKIVISPAKTLDFESKLPTNLNSMPLFLKQSKIINEVLKQKMPAELAVLMNISDKLAELNWTRNSIFKMPFTPNNARPAVYAFNGDVYGGINVKTMAPEKIKILQDKLRIISGLYGLLKPLDLIQPYRLEMGTKLPIGDKKNLYDFWKIDVTAALNKELSKEDLFVNLASNEYFLAINTKALKAKVVTPEFKDYKNGNLKVISFFAKKARGLMVRYIIDNNCETIDDLKKFNSEGYAFDDNLSSENNLIFTR